MPVLPLTSLTITLDKENWALVIAEPLLTFGGLSEQPLESQTSGQLLTLIRGMYLTAHTLGRYIAFQILNFHIGPLAVVSLLDILGMVAILFAVL